MAAAAAAAGASRAMNHCGYGYGYGYGYGPEIVVDVIILEEWGSAARLLHGEDGENGVDCGWNIPPFECRRLEKGGEKMEQGRVEDQSWTRRLVLVAGLAEGRDHVTVQCARRRSTGYQQQQQQQQQKQQEQRQQQQSKPLGVARVA
ncbi:hypothetical protein E4U43_005175 [Claviceps pusilla]|uniref:Uncharacterized protein n=1 Tax=Claviceps pusilla TaxID=123648 RepID=A0A9P7N3S9_9HYPO|nr:hypothetical protein E4U43_005175 [Claviceps pusilla]